MSEINLNPFFELEKAKVKLRTPVGQRPFDLVAEFDIPTDRPQDALRWLLYGPRRSGRTTMLALLAIEHADDNIGENVWLADHMDSARLDGRPSGRSRSVLQNTVENLLRDFQTKSELWAVKRFEVRDGFVVRRE